MSNAKQRREVTFTYKYLIEFEETSQKFKAYDIIDNYFNLNIQSGKKFTMDGGFVKCLEVINESEEEVAYTYEEALADAAKSVVEMFSKKRIAKTPYNKDDVEKSVNMLETVLDDTRTDAMTLLIKSALCELRYWTHDTIKNAVDILSIAERINPTGSTGHVGENPRRGLCRQKTNTDYNRDEQS
jgi:hypothetical protein